MITLSGAKGVILNSLGSTGLILRKNSPEILLGVGVVGIVVGTIVACRATLKAEEILVDTKDKLDKIDQVKENHKDDYTEEDAKKDTAIVYVKTSVELVKEYIPAVIIIGVSIGLILQSHNLLNKRNAALVAAYKLIDASFKEYRKRVLEEYGEEADQKLRFGQQEVKFTELNAKGKEKTVTKKILGTNDISPYSFIFSEETSTQFKRNYDMNLNILRTVQRYANDILRIRGHIFLNEVLDSLGIARTPAGALVGWVSGDNIHNELNDQVVIFGIDDPINEEMQNNAESMMQAFYLNFNVDGIIYDLI